MIGVRGASIEQQVGFLNAHVTPEIAASAMAHDVHGSAARMNGETGLGPIEAIVLYCFIRAVRPKKVVQVGAGVSTAIMLLALGDEHASSHIVAIDPFPTPLLEKAHAEGKIELRKEGAQETPPEVFTGLGPGDLLFIDSTHTVKPGSEVNYLMLEVLPRLKKGVYVHFHDIYFPYDYQRNLLSDGLFFHNESTLLHAFLIGNQDYRIAVSLSMLHYAAPDAIRRLVPSYRPQPNDDGLRKTDSPDGHFPSSIYLMKER